VADNTGIEQLDQHRAVSKDLHSLAGKLLPPHTVVSMMNRYKGWAITCVVQVSRGVLHLEPVPGPVWDAEAVRHIIGGLVVAGHCFHGRPSEVVVQHLSQRTVVG